MAPFTALPFDDASFDLVFDRCAVTYASPVEAEAAVAEVRRVLRPGGKFLFNPYSDRSSNADGPSAHEVRGAWAPVAGRSEVRFYGRSDIDGLFEGWKLVEVVHVEETEETAVPPELRAQWRVIAEAE